MSTFLSVRHAFPPAPGLGRGLAARRKPRAAESVIALNTIGGLLIAGGRSSRFGAEKALALFDGAPMMDRATALFAGLPGFAISARSGSGAEARARQLGIDVVYDDPNLPSGPLTGVLSGLAWAKQHGFEFLATAPCDAPCLPANMVTQLAENIGAARAAFAVTSVGQHPLCALWSVGLHDALSDELRTGEHPAVRAFLAGIGAQGVHFAEAPAFANANTPEALAALEQGA
jgi:molybdopterin-guanine dinucleotide biosynthesis protein A